MLSTSYLLNTSPTNSQAPKLSTEDKRILIITVILLLVIDLVILCFGIHFLLKCSEDKDWNPVLVILLIVLMFTPTFGSLLGIALIIYGLSGACDKKAMSFSFY